MARRDATAGEPVGGSSKIDLAAANNRTCGTLFLFRPTWCYPVGWSGGVFIGPPQRRRSPQHWMPPRMYVSARRCRLYRH